MQGEKKGGLVLGFEPMTKFHLHTHALQIYIYIHIHNANIYIHTHTHCKWKNHIWTIYKTEPTTGECLDRYVMLCCDIYVRICDKNMSSKSNGE